MGRLDPRVGVIGSSSTSTEDMGRASSSSSCMSITCCAIAESWVLVIPSIVLLISTTIADDLRLTAITPDFDIEWIILSFPSLAP